MLFSDVVVVRGGGGTATTALFLPAVAEVGFLAGKSARNIFFCRRKRNCGP